MDKLHLDYIYMIEVKHPYLTTESHVVYTKIDLYVGHTTDLERRIRNHQTSRTSYGRLTEFHKLMRMCGYRVYLLDVRLDRCEAGLETRWISFVNDWCKELGFYDCYNTAQIVSDYDRAYCEKRWKHKVLYKEVNEYSMTLRETERKEWETIRGYIRNG